MVGEDALIKAAGGDFVAVLAGFLVLSIVYLAYRILEWMMKTIPEQMAADRAVFQKGLSDMAEAIRTSSREQAERFEKCFQPHDVRAEKILEKVESADAKLNARPCMNGKQ